MIRKAIRRATVLLAVLGIPAMIVVAPLPASAALTSGSMCEYYGLFCINTANFSLYTSATESLTQARTIKSEAYYSTGTYRLIFNGDTSDCLGATNDGTKAEIKPCSGSDVYWIRTTDPGGTNGAAFWENTGATNTIGTKMYLTGIECNGCQYMLKVKGYNGGYQSFIFR